MLVLALAILAGLVLAQEHDQEVSLGEPQPVVRNIM